MYQFFVKDGSIFSRCEVIISFAPYPPTVGHAACHLLCRSFPAQRTIGLRYTGFTKIFLCNDVSSYLAPLFGYLYIGHFKNHFSRRISNNTRSIVVLKHIKRRNALFGKATLELKSLVILCSSHWQNLLKVSKFFTLKM